MNDQEIREEIRACYNDIVDLYRSDHYNCKAEELIRERIAELEKSY